MAKLQRSFSMHWTTDDVQSNLIQNLEQHFIAYLHFVGKLFQMHKLHSI